MHDAAHAAAAVQVSIDGLTAAAAALESVRRAP